MSSFNLQKWSLEVATERGDVLSAELTSYGFGGFGRAILTAGVWTADGPEVHDSLITGLPVVGPDGRARVRGYSLEQDRDGFRVSLDLPRIALDLLLASGGEWRPNGNGVLVARGTRVFRWVVPQFRASVSGALILGSEKVDVRGTGCLEAVRTDLPPWRLRFAEIFRGKAHLPSTTLLFLQLTTEEGTVIQNILVKRDFGPGLRWVDDYQFQVDDQGHPGRTFLRHPAFTLSLTEKRVLQDGPGPIPREIRPASPWKLLDRLYGRPESRKVLSEARLSMGGYEELGLAFHERVVWRRGLKS